MEHPEPTGPLEVRLSPDSTGLPVLKIKQSDWRWPRGTSLRLSPPYSAQDKSNSARANWRSAESFFVFLFCLPLLTMHSVHLPVSHQERVFSFLSVNAHPAPREESLGPPSLSRRFPSAQSSSVTLLHSPQQTRLLEPNAFSPRPRRTHEGPF